MTPHVPANSLSDRVRNGFELLVRDGKRITDDYLPRIKERAEHPATVQNSIAWRF